MQKVRAQKAKAGVSEEVLKVQFAELEEPEVPIAGTNVLMMFLELSAARQSGMNGPLAISYTELKAYLDVTDTQLLPWELDMIRVMDKALLEQAAELQSKETP